MSDVGWPEDDLREQPIERTGLERDRAALAIDGRPGDPAAATEQVGDDVPWARVRVDPGADEAGRRRWRKSVEDRKGGTRLGVMGSATGHRTDASRRTAGLPTTAVRRPTTAVQRPTNPPGRLGARRSCAPG